MLSVSNADQAPEDDDPLENHSITQSMEQAHPPCMSNELS